LYSVVVSTLVFETDFLHVDLRIPGTWVRTPVRPLLLRLSDGLLLFGYICAEMEFLVERPLLWEKFVDLASNERLPSYLLVTVCTCLHRQPRSLGTLNLDLRSSPFTKHGNSTGDDKLYLIDLVVNCHRMLFATRFGGRSIGSLANPRLIDFGRYVWLQ
jgi:hypothetical protein